MNHKHNWKSLEERIAPEESRPEEMRSPFDKDRTRILHSAAFRRLQGKTQVLGIGESDFLRTRLTHSIEVANIGRGLLQYLKKNGSERQRAALPDNDLIEAIAYAHDLGHSPFGHNGEKSLNIKMSKHGGFEGNGQTLRILSNLESRHPAHGLNLTRRTLLGILKYPAPYSRLLRKNKSIIGPPKCYLNSESKTVQWLLNCFGKSDRIRFTEIESSDFKHNHKKTKCKTLDCSIMDIADEISYGVHDLEDGIQIGMIERKSLTDNVVNRGQGGETLNGLFKSEWGNKWQLKDAIDNLFQDSRSRESDRKAAIGAIVHALIASINFSEDKNFDHPILRLNATLGPEANLVLKHIKEISWKEMISRQSVQTLEYRGRVLVEGIFDALSKYPKKLLPADYLERFNSCKTEDQRMRTICDYISGMTDSYATKFYERLYIPRLGNVFERL